ncbi:MAG: phage head closure protein [Hoeflea sp.]|nr:phage head closure protein [Hoeflea sp.]
MGGLFVDPGLLSARLSLETPEELPDGQGGMTEGWMPVASLWGRIEPLAARPDEVAGAAVAVITHRITIRHRDGVSHAMRFVHRGRNLVIRAVRDPDERRRYLVCDCEETMP